MNIVEINPQHDFTLLIKAENGEYGTFDVRPHFQLEPFEPLKKIEEFFNVRNGRYFAGWQCGAREKKYLI